LIRHRDSSQQASGNSYPDRRKKIPGGGPFHPTPFTPAQAAPCAFYQDVDKGRVSQLLTKDELLTHIVIYWGTESLGTSFLPYYDYANAGVVTWIAQGIKKLTGSTQVPAAFALFPKDISHPPRDWAERFFNVKRWHEMPRGGHFAAMEEPELLAEELRTWFRTFRTAEQS
jgi:pimeloyl-ACP methyl ester carboxylesterase